MVFIEWEFFEVIRGIIILFVVILVGLDLSVLFIRFVFFLKELGCCFFYVFVVIFIFYIYYWKRNII